MNYYEILGVREDATNSQILEAYRRLVNEFSPNKLEGLDGPFKDIQEAWEILKDDVKKREYDTKLQFQTGGVNKHSNLHISEIKYGGFWIRLVAYIIDIIIVTVILVIVIFLISIIFPAEFSGSVENGSWENTEKLLQIIIGVFYFAGLESSKNQATLGKKVSRLKVIREDQKDVTFGLSLLRIINLSLSIPLTLGIGILMIAFNRKKQGLHDIFCKTLVVYR